MTFVVVQEGVFFFFLVPLQADCFTFSIRVRICGVQRPDYKGEESGFWEDISVPERDNTTLLTYRLLPHSVQNS